MDLLDTKTDDELLRSLLAEIAKAKNEINCAQTDIKKATNRLNFLIVVANKMIERNGD
mgnify:CR=1 FL=1